MFNARLRTKVPQTFVCKRQHAARGTMQLPIIDSHHCRQRGETDLIEVPFSGSVATLYARADRSLRRAYLRLRYFAKA